jgi:glutathione S-transferase
MMFGIPKWLFLTGVVASSCEIISVGASKATTTLAFCGPSSACQRQPSVTRLQATVASWNDIETILGSSYREDSPVSIDSVSDPSQPSFSDVRPTLFRERHGWCPYSERVWLTLELGGLDYDTVRIDNTGGGPRPSYFGGQTPQMKWPDGRVQGESMNLVDRLDQDYGCQLQSYQSSVQDCVSQFRNIFPRARPSSRAAYLFQYNGEPLWKSNFQETLQGTNDLIGQTKGPFFCGNDLTAADVAWAPFLERYRYQLPCLHEGLDPADPSAYPNLAQWYAAMDNVPVYACRVKGDASSWRKVLAMAGFGNAGLPPDIGRNMDARISYEQEEAKACIDLDVWKEYASSRPHVTSSPHADAASIVTRNREAIMKDMLKRGGGASSKGLSSAEEEVDLGLRALACVLLDEEGENAKDVPGLAAIAKFLDERMCVPRDMGAMSAATIKVLACELE